MYKYMRRQILILLAILTAGGLPSTVFRADAALDRTALAQPAVGMYGAICASQVDIDLIYEADAEKLDENVGALIKDLLYAKINTVFLQACSDDDGSGNIKSVYFHTEHAPVKANVFGRIATRLKANGFRVIAWMHTLSCQWLFEDNPENQMKAIYEDKAGWYDRATPFSEETRSLLLGLFGDLSKYSDIDGVLFQDDLYMNDYEDFSAPAQKAFAERFHMTLDENILDNQGLLNLYTRFKTETLISLTESLMRQVRENIPNAVSMRNIYSALITEPESEEWFAQNYEDFIKRYDYTVIMAYPYLEENIGGTRRWMSEVIDKATTTAGAENKQKIIVKIQTYDWNTRCWLPDTEVAGYLKLIREAGLHSAMYPHKD